MTSAAEAPRAPDDGALAAGLPDRIKYLVFGVMAFGQFMALLDIQIVAASLTQVQAGLSAGPDEISWVQTGYLIAELVMVPLAAFLAQAVSTRWLFAASALLFTLASILCGIAWDIQSLVAFRVLQGFVGGAMIPTAFATGFAMFSGRQRAVGPAILGMVSVLAPTLGPTIGGWLTETFGWRAIFVVNVLPGAVVAFLTVRYAHVDRGDLVLLRRIDYVQLGAIALFLGGLEFALEEGPRRQWLEDSHTATALWLSLVALLVFLERAVRSTTPILQLSPLRRPTFALACVINVAIGFSLYASTFMVPLFLGQIRDYSPIQIGQTVVVTGVSQVLATAIAAALSQRIDQRIVLIIGLAVLAAALWMTSRITPLWGYEALFWPQVLRGFALMLCIVPSVDLALGPFAGAELKHASGLFNLMRNLGGAIGIAVASTLLGDLARVHAAGFGDTRGDAGSNVTQAARDLAARFMADTTDPARAADMAQAVLHELAAREALTLAFGDVFRMMAILALLALALALFCRRPARSQD